MEFIIPTMENLDYESENVYKQYYNLYLVRRGFGHNLILEIYYRKH